MIKQEEIREGIKEVLSGWGIGNWDIDHSAIDDLLNYLHSQGIVIKVDRELPKPKDPKYLMWTEDEIIEAGCGFFEPLIEEK